MLSWFTKNWFLAGLFLALLLAFFFPEQGASGGILRTEITTKLAVALLFFVRGTLLPLAELRTGILGWRLHALVHAYIFLLFPLAVFLFFEVAGLFWVIDPDLRLGFLFLAILPTTVSTAVVFTSMANGNVAGSVFNATVSNCIGVFVVPLWIAWLINLETKKVSADFVIMQIVLLVIVPLVAGQIVKPFLKGFPLRNRHAFEFLSSALILFVMFAAFANSVVEGVWLGYGWKTFTGVFAASVIIFSIATLLAWHGGKALGMAWADRVSFVFCGPQKTLASGVTIANVMFPGDPALTMILLPLLFYHFIQLFGGSFIVSSLMRRA